MITNQEMVEAKRNIYRDSEATRKKCGYIEFGSYVLGMGVFFSGLLGGINLKNREFPINHQLRGVESVLNGLYQDKRLIEKGYEGVPEGLKESFDNYYSNNKEKLGSLGELIEGMEKEVVRIKESDEFKPYLENQKLSKNLVLGGLLVGGSLVCGCWLLSGMMSKRASQDEQRRLAALEGRDVDSKFD